MARWRFDEAELRDWIGSLTPEELLEPVTVNGLEGRPLETYLAHVVEHGITEFTRAAAILAQVGQDPGELSLIAYLAEAAPISRPGA
jgi:hypothetical protein